MWFIYIIIIYVLYRHVGHAKIYAYIIEIRVDRARVCQIKQLVQLNKNPYCMYSSQNSYINI